jgi:FAD dependent oxidoreductase TIGR03364
VVYDVAVVGVGIVGLAHALAAARRGKRVVVLERAARANGASLRNFGIVTVTGQQAGDCWHMARRARAIWVEVAEAAAIPIVQRGLLVTARRPEAEAVIDAFLRTDMAEGCRRLTAAQAQEICPALRPAVTAALHSPHELRVESRAALPRLADWLAAQGVTFCWSTAVHGIEAPRIHTSRGLVEAEAVVVCPGDDVLGLFADRIAAYGLTRCQLQMLRIAPERGTALGAAVMSDLGLARYSGYAELPEARALQARLDREQAAQRAHGVHLIV